MENFKQQVIQNSSILMQKSEIVSDIYDILLYTLCLSVPAQGAFLSTDGTTEYFDAVSGSFRSDRIGKKGGIKIWEYDIPNPGCTRLTNSSVWLYKAMKLRWLIGLNAQSEPDKHYIENLIVTSSVATELIKRLEQRIDGKDQLSGLLDRGALFRDMTHLASVSRVKGIPLHLLFIDLNNFKTVNDILGHDMGDRVLMSQAFEIRKQVKGYGNAYRYGGDEFCVVLCGLTEKKVSDIAHRIELASEQAPGGLSVSASVGVATYQGEPVEEFIKKADTKMYDRKRELKNSNLALQAAGRGAKSQIWSSNL